MRGMILCFVVGIGLPGYVRLCAEELPTFIELIDRMEQQRKRITSYDLRVTAEVEDEALPELLSNGKTYPRTTRILSYELNMLRELERGYSVIARREVWEDIATKQRKTLGWKVFAVTTRGVLIADEESGGIRAQPLKGWMKYFDPLGSGLGSPMSLNRERIFVKSVPTIASARSKCWQSELASSSCNMRIVGRHGLWMRITTHGCLV